MMFEKIDFVITWVDGSDPEWLKDRNHYAALEQEEIDECRFRDWGTLRYWFRGVEKFAPWVNNIFFITCGHLPKWLNTDHPKLRIIKHSDYIPAEFLPTFNSYVIEYYLYKIPDLSNHFVYFNDDMFLINKVNPGLFFQNGVPRDLGRMTITILDGIFGTSVLMANTIISENFDKKDVIRHNLFKWFHPTYGKGLFFNLICSQIRKNKFVGFFNPHLQQAFLKKSFEDVWSNCENNLIRASKNRFRDYGDISFWLFRYWQLASGNFCPYNIMRDGRYFRISNSNYMKVAEYIRRQKGKFICVNDTEGALNFDIYKTAILSAFKDLLPEKSMFEKK